METILLYLIDHFDDLMNLHLTVSIVILFVICVRQLMKGAPKIFSYALWGIVLLRLLVPVSIESPVSFVPERTEFSSMVELNEELPEIQFELPQDRADNEWHRENTAPEEPLVQTYRSLDAETYLTFVWLFGIAVMLLYSAVSYWKLRRRLKVVVPYRKGIFLADDIDSPFVMGVFRPAIYLPGSLEPWERTFIIAHERHHIRRGDHIFKALGFLALTIHWFNPLVWVAFILAGRDMEMSCDEAVIRKLGEDVRAEYSASLLNLATGHRMFTGTPLAFGEGDPTGRVRNLAKWKKPAIWIMVICVVVCAVLAVCLLTDPEIEKPLEDMTMTTGSASVGVGDLYFTLPEGLSISMRESEAQPEVDPYQFEHIIWKNGMIAGGISILKSTDPALYIAGDYWDWVESLNIPENVPEDRLMMSVEWTGDSEVERDCVIVAYGNNGLEETKHYLFNTRQIVYDLWFDMEQISEEEINLILETLDVPVYNWGISIQPDRVSRTGATALFVCDDNSILGIEGIEVTYGDLMTLQRLEKDAWIYVTQLAGYDYYVGDSSYPVVNGYGMVHEWQDRFGELADGQYRMGKLVTITRSDGTSEERMFYGEFSIPEDILTGYIPLEELPERYGAEQAMIDGCFVTEDGVARLNQELFHAFTEKSWNGIPSTIRLYNCHYGETYQWTAMDLHFDGNMYTLTSQYSIDGNSTYTFRYLKHFTGEKAWADADHDGFEYYMLMNEDNITWQDIQDGKLENMEGNPAHWTVYADFTYKPKQPQLPTNLAKVDLVFDGETLASTTDFDRLEKIWILFAEAEYLGYEPKTHSIGVGLNLVLTTGDGEEITIELDPDNDLCRIDGEYVFYGAADEPCYIEKLWYYLDIPAWPEEIYAACENAWRGQ